MDALTCLKTRCSVRRYTQQPIGEQEIQHILEAAIQAPSGKNGQPWRFKVITDQDAIVQLSGLSAYGVWMKTAPLWILVFLDHHSSYHYVKDVQSCGAAIQNMMLAAHALGIGSCWVGEILSKAEEIKKILHLGEHLELMALITFGYPAGQPIKPARKQLGSFLL